jgi:hypothetical protein
MSLDILTVYSDNEGYKGGSVTYRLGSSCFSSYY